MPTAEKNKVALEGLIAKANEATGATDEDLSTAVDTLIAGFGVGSGVGSSGNDEVLLLSILNRTITELNDDRITKLGDYSLAKGSLTTVRLPNCKTIGMNALSDNSNLTELYLPAYDPIYASRSVLQKAFYNNKSLTTAYIPKATFLPAGTFHDCKKLSNLTLNPNISKLCGNSLMNTAIIEFIYPSVIALEGNSDFSGCTQLTTVDISPTQVRYQSFYKCEVLTALALRAGTVAVLDNVNAFTNTPIASGTGYIYVPSTLIDTYKDATNWITYAEQFRILEEYTIDGTVTGALDKSKIGGTA